jgi:hypothetical protein
MAKRILAVALALAGVVALALLAATHSHV